MPSINPRNSQHAFTLIELLTVMAIIGILAAIIIPTVSSVRVSANKAKTKVQFNQWAAAIESFRSEYGFYPSFDSSNKVNGSAVSSGDHLFHDTLAGRRRDGEAIGSAASSQNRKRIAFYTFSEGDFTDTESTMPNLLQDAFGNTEIAVLVDRNLDGRIDSSDYSSAPIVDGIAPTTDDIPSSGIRMGVAFYAPAPDADANNPDFIFSWK
jgi:prepilin-type N-terminal cleavage/methylation domain-containing protein